MSGLSIFQQPQQNSLIAVIHNNEKKYDIFHNLGYKLKNRQRYNARRFLPILKVC